MSRLIQSHSAWRFVISFLAGCMMTLSLAPFHMGFVWFFGIPALVFLLDRASFKAAFFIGWTFAFGFFLTSLYWIGIAFLVDAEAYAWLLPLAVTGLPAYLAIYWGLACLMARYLWTQDGWRILTLAVCLTIMEILRGQLFTGFPWNAPGYAVFISDGLAQWASYVGLWGLCFLVFAFTGLPVLIAERRFRLSIIWTIGFIIIFAAGSYRLHSSVTSDTALNIRLVQPAVPQSDKWRYENGPAIFRQLLSQTASSNIAAQDLIIWPESAFPGLIEEDIAARAAIARILPEKTMLVTGSIRREIIGDAGGGDDLIFNSIIALDSSGEIKTRYDKFHLVPWGEYLPLESILTPLGLRRLVSLPGSFRSGPGPQTLKLSNLPSFSPLICYEIIFPSQIVASQRPDFILNVTNDGWFGDSTGPWQHLDQARMRAIEQGLPVIRAANTGISAIINSNGIVVSRTSINQQAVLDSRLPAAFEATFYAQYGNWPVLVCLILFLIVAIQRKNAN